MSVGELIRETRKRHQLDQRALARRARTTQRHVSRIERGEHSPTVATVERLLSAMGERLELQTRRGPRANPTTAELRDTYKNTTPEERFAQVAELSSMATGLASAPVKPAPKRARS